MVKPVPAVGSFHIGSPSHCAAAGVASNVRPRVRAARFVVPAQRQGETVWDQGARSRRRWSNGRNRRSASQSCVALMHPHEADRHGAGWGGTSFSSPSHAKRQVEVQVQTDTEHTHVAAALLPLVVVRDVRAEQAEAQVGAEHVTELRAGAVAGAQVPVADAGTWAPATAPARSSVTCSAPT